MPAKGRAHFDTYTEQNRVKHAILAKYLRAYLLALRNTADAFNYIDGFAGAGSYSGTHAGSPLFALEVLANQSKPFAASFVENDSASYKQLEATIQNSRFHLGVGKQIELRCGEFSACIADLLTPQALATYKRIATFAFVDPCGVTGLYVADLAKILARQYGECLVFLNYDGLSRWIGGVRAGSHGREKLDRFFGDHNAAEAALAFAASSSGPSRETQLLDLYVDALRKCSGAKFVLPFRFRATTRDRTSHYLIHLAQHWLAFKIMKEVMKTVSGSTEDIGTFSFIPPDELNEQGILFRPNADRAKNEIIAALRDGKLAVALFANEWPLRPSDMFIGREYKQMLLELENDGVIDVVDPRSGVAVPPSKRSKRAGEPTLADRYLIRLRG